MNNELKPSVIKPWLKHFDRKVLQEPIPENTLYGQLKESNKNYMNGRALNYYGTYVSYGELIENADKYARAFADIGVKPGDYVSLYTVSIPETIYSIYGLNKIGAVCNLIDVRTDAEHTRDFIEKADSDVLIVLDIFYEKIAPYLEELGIRKVIVQSAGESLPLIKKVALRHKTRGAFDPSIADGDRIILNSDFVASVNGACVSGVSYQKDMPAIVTRTGGTTGISKGVVLTNDNLNAVYDDFRALFGDMTGESILNFLPLAASYGIVVGIHASLCSSLENILIPNFSPDDFPSLVFKFKPNHIVGVPVFYDKLMNSRKAKGMDLSFIITMGAGGDTANPTLEKQLRDFAKSHGVRYPLAAGYGMSETSSACAFGVKNVHRDGSAGIPSKNAVIGIFEPGTSNELGFGEVGEICITGPVLMKEYLDEPEETEKVFMVHSDGQKWVHSGDLGYIDEDGFLFVNGRIKRSIIRFDGHKNYPTQIEAVVAKHPAVASCSVIAIKEYRYSQGEAPLAVVELTPEHYRDEDMPEEEVISFDKDELRGEILRFCCDNIEERSCPFDVVIEDKLPLTRNGKINVQALTKKYRDYMKDKVNA